MANETNEERRAVRVGGILVGILALLVVAGAAWWLFFRDRGLQVPVARHAAKFPMLTDLESFVEAPNLRMLVGRQVSLRGVPAGRVIGDWTFYVGKDVRHTIPVVIADEKSGKVEESAIRVETGVLLDIDGSVRRNDDPDHLGNSRYIDERELAELKTKPIYIEATRVERHVGRNLAE